MSQSLWSQIERILISEDASFPALVKAAGLDPARDFKGIYLNGLPLSGEDVSGFDFSYSDLSGTGIRDARKNLKTKFTGAFSDGLSLDPEVIAFNRNLRSLNYNEIAKRISDALGQGRLRLDVISFSTVIKRSPGEDERNFWYQEMLKAGVTPNVVTFSTLIDKAGSEELRTRWYEAMVAAGVTPNVVTYNTLIDKAGSEELRTRWYEAMIAAGVTPDDYTLSILEKHGMGFNKGESGLTS
jgi:Pentatricopeptide repeat domain